MHIIKKTKATLAVVLLSFFNGYSQQNSLPYEGIQEWQDSKDERMEWFREARFGMFIHWGLYSAAGGNWEGKQYPQHYSEWIQTWGRIPSSAYGQVLKPQFTAAKLDADQWAELAKKAGMKYVVLTSRHHDGFSIFNSQQPFALNNPITGGTNISPEGRDLYGEVMRAFQKKGIRTGAYYSLLDWQHPDSHEGFQFNPNTDNYQPKHEVYKDYLYEQVKELSTNYGPLDVLWVDFSSKTKQGETWGTKRILKDLIKWQPQIIVNNRFWDGLENKNGDIGTPEKYIPPTGLPGMDWEVSHTMNESYGYSDHDNKWKSYDKVMRLFLETVSKGGNFLLNVGPDGEGSIPAPAIKLLEDIGQWMDINNASVYGTTASPFQTLDWGYCTQKPGKLFLHVFDVPTSGVLNLPLLSEVKKIYPLHAPQELLTVTNDNSGKVIKLPKVYNGPQPIVIVVETEGTLEVSSSTVQAQDDGRIALTANEAKLQGNGGIKLIGATTHNPNRPNAIGAWSNKQDEAYWDIKIQRPGTYKVVLNYLAHTDTKDKIAITLADQSINYTFNAKKDKDFKEIEIGTIEVNQQILGQENVKLILKATSIEDSTLPEISQITLIPTNK